MLHHQSDELLFGCFMTTLNTTFESKVALEDKGYESYSLGVCIHIKNTLCFGWGVWSLHLDALRNL